jgi:GTPase SAR1 family protein
MDEANILNFLRITVVGSNGCGKTCLINSFVNARIPSRYMSTDKATIYYKKLESLDESEGKEIWRSILLEVEDTPGSERGNDDDEGAPAGDQDSAEKRIVKGSRVNVVQDKSEVLALFQKFQTSTGKLKYRPAMDAMIGKEFRVKSVAKDGTIYLPSPDGLEDWGFPPGSCKVKLSLSLPIDEFLNLGEKEKVVLNSAHERRKYLNALRRPLQAYERPVCATGKEKTLTRNRMGFLICYDVSDDQGSSLREAMAVHKMLNKSLDAQTSTLKPYIFLVGCKSDRAVSEVVRKQNENSARVYGEEENIKTFVTSAMTHAGVDDVFSTMISAIRAREGLHMPSGEEDKDEEIEAKGACFSQ